MKVNEENIYYRCWKQTGLKKFEFANRLGMTQNGVSNYFHNMAIPSIPIAKKMIEVLKEYGHTYTLDELYAHVPAHEPAKDFELKKSKRYITPRKIQKNEEMRRKQRMEKSEDESKTRMEKQIEFEEKRRAKAGIQG
jgi:transcriptional regulator with XRE-family HTH domain